MAGAKQRCWTSPSVGWMGDEAICWEAGVEASLPDWPSFKAAFLERFDPTQEELFSRLAYCRQECNETVRKYTDRYCDLAGQLGVDTQQDPIHMYNFLQGLHVKVHSKVFLMWPRA